MSAVQVRELTTIDRAAVAFSIRRLSQRSHFQRYLHSYPRADEREPARLTDVDHWHHEALIAFATHPRIPIGVAEYVRLARFDEAEFAVTVIDDWQRHGVGRALAAELRDRARKAGIRVFTGTALCGNRGALALARGLGECTITGADGTALELAIRLRS